LLKSKRKQEKRDLFSVAALEREEQFLA
jgi:hypothetical protein